MKPLSSEEKARIIANHPESRPSEIEQDIDEYERLLAERFTHDPDLRAAPAVEAKPSLEDRIERLYRRLYTKVEAGA